MAPPINRFIYLIILIGLSQSVIAQSKPNISSIKVDDQGYADWGFNESNVIQAPHIDNLVTESIQSLQSYVTNVEDSNSVVYSMEAEHAVISGTAEIGSDCSNASNSSFVKLFNVAGNSVAFNDIEIPESGLYRLTFDYFHANSTRVEAVVNEQSIGVFEIPEANWCYQGPAAQHSIGVNLDAGLNNIKFVVVDIAGPFIDKISLAKVIPDEINFEAINIRLLEGQSIELRIIASESLITNESLELNLIGLNPAEITVTPQVIEFAIGDQSAIVTLTSLTGDLTGTIELTNPTSGLKIGESRISTINVTTNPASFFVSADGYDYNNGMSETTPWKTLQQVSKSRFIPGDSIFFRRGEVFAGQLAINSSGTTGTPIVFSSYGSGDKSIIDGANADGGAYREAVLIENQQFIELRDLKITNDRKVSRDGVSDEVGFGIYIHNSSDEVMKFFRLINLNIEEVYPIILPDLDFDNVKVAGVFLKTEKNLVVGKEKYVKDMVMEDCYVAHSGKFGFWSQHSGGNDGVGDDQLNRNNDFVFRNNHFFETGGSGITPGRTYNCLVENNVFEYTGYSDVSEPRLVGRGSGAWFFSCCNVVSQFNKSLHVRGPKDSYGQHIDFGNEYVVLQYNYSEDSEGGFVEILGDNKYCTYRYNISVNDGLRDTNGNSLWVSTWSIDNIPSDKSYIYNNSIYVGGDITPDIDIEGADTYVYNNIFYVTDKAKIGERYLVKNTGGGALTVDNNIFFGDVSTNLSDLDVASILANPRYHQPGMLNAEGYKLEEGSPALNTAMTFTEPPFPQAGIGIFKDITANASQDYFGNPVDLSSGTHIGAFNGTALPRSKAIVNISLSDNELASGENVEVIAMLDRYALSDQTVSFEITGIPQDLYTLSANEISVEQEKKLGSVLLTVNEDNRNTDDILGSILFTGVSDGLELGTTLSSDITILKSDYFTALDDKLEVVSIYPNPVRDYLKIEVEELILSSVEVFNIHGYLVFKRKLVNGILDISRLMNGVYFIKIVTNNQKIHFKRIVKY